MLSHVETKAESGRQKAETPTRTVLRQGFCFILHPSFFILLLCLPALVPMLSVSFWQSHDGLHHIFRIANFDAAMRSGVLFPRWADQLGFGYGFPVTHYYAPLAYYLAEIFHRIGTGFLDSIKLTYALGFIATAFSMYWLARDVVGARAALLAAVVYAYYPYHLADLYMRGTLTEFMALALLPLVVWSARRIVQRPMSKACAERSRSIPSPTYVILFALLLAALILTHNLTAFLFLPFLILYVVLVGDRTLNTVRTAPNGVGHRTRDMGFWFGIWNLGLGICLAFALTAFYWLPALGEVSWIRAGQISASVDDIATLLTPVAQFVSTSFAQSYVADAPASLQHPLSLLVALLTVGAVVVAFVRRARLTAAQRREWCAWLVIAVLAVFAMLDLSAPLWSALKPLAFVQYPYRLHAVLGLALAMLIGLGASGEWRVESDKSRLTMTVTRHWPLVTTFAIISALIATSLAVLPITPQSLPGHKEPISEAQINVVGMSEYDYQTALWARLYGGPWLLEYLPAWVTEAREEFFLPNPHPTLPRYTGEVSAPSVAVERYQPQQRALRVESAEPFPLSFHTFYFPAWQVRVDGVPVPTFPTGPLALVGADVPAGAHEISLALEGTTLQHVGEALTLLAAARVLFVALLRARNRKLWLSLVLVSVAAVLGWRSLEMHRDAALQPVTATFEQEFDLIGYDVARASYRPGDVADITLYWFARETPREDFKVFIHLDGVSGRAGQVDAQPGQNFSPTTRWQRGEVIADHYRLKISPSAVPGPYEMFAGMYRQQPMQNLSVVSPRATPDNRVRLGALEIR